MQFTELEYLGGEAVPVIDSITPPESPPLWLIRGTAIYDINFYMEASDENEVSLAQCNGTATYNIEARVFKDIVVNFCE